MLLSTISSMGWLMSVRALPLPAHQGRMAAHGRRAPAHGDRVVRASPHGVTPPAGLTRGRRRGPEAGASLKRPADRRTARRSLSRWAVHLGLLCSAAAALGTLDLLHVRIA